MSAIANLANNTADGLVPASGLENYLKHIEPGFSLTKDGYSKLFARHHQRPS